MVKKEYFFKIELIEKRLVKKIICKNSIFLKSRTVGIQKYCYEKTSLPICKKTFIKARI